MVKHLSTSGLQENNVMRYLNNLKCSVKYQQNNVTTDLNHNFDFLGLLFVFSAFVVVVFRTDFYLRFQHQGLLRYHTAYSPKRSL